MADTRTTDPRVTLRHTTPPVWPASSFSTNPGGVGQGDRIYRDFVHSPSHRNAFAGGVPTFGDSPLSIWANQIVVQPGSPADRKGRTSSGIAANSHSPNGHWGWFGTGWMPLPLYENRPGETTSLLAGWSEYYVTWPAARKAGLYLEAPAEGTGLILRPMISKHNPLGIRMAGPAGSGQFRVLLRGPRWINRSAPVGVPLGAPGLEDLVWWGDTPPGALASWQPIPEFQLVGKFAIAGVTHPSQVTFDGGVNPHGEYVFGASPMPLHPMTGEVQPRFLQQIIDAGVNWGHADNVLPDSPNGYAPRKVEGVRPILSEQFVFPLDGIVGGEPTDPVPSPPPVLPPEEPGGVDDEPSPEPPADPEPGDSEALQALLDVASALTDAAARVRVAVEDLRQE